MIVDREMLATRSLLCKGSWVEVDILEFTGHPDHRDTVPYGYQYKKHNDRQFFLSVSAHNIHNNRPCIHEWISGAGFLSMIKILTGQERPSPLPAAFKMLEPPDGDLTDPQRSNMAFFRRRCRYDVLRVMAGVLAAPTSITTLSLDDVRSSALLTRLHHDDDIRPAMNYWHKEQFLTHARFGPAYNIDESRDEEIQVLIDKYDWEESPASARHKSNQDTETTHDVFICHASEDKQDFVGPLADALVATGLRVWYDEFTLKLGDSLRRSIDRGLVSSRYGIVVLSKAFFAKAWPQYELDGLAQKEVDGEKVILPIWHGVSRRDVVQYSPSLADRLAESSELPLAQLVGKILEVVSPAQE